MPKLKLIIAYDGTDFAGWQIQPNAPTVASVLQKAYQATFDEEISVLGASRTDAGVHALGQVASVRVNRTIDSEKMRHAWNAAMPRSINIRSLQEVPDDFNPFIGVKEKTYWYHFFYRRPLPMMARFGWYYPFVDRVDFSKLQDCLALYQGTHDFASFCTVEEGDVTVRTINSIKMTRFDRFGVGRIEVKGPGFVRFQIRRMVGYAFDIARRPEESAATIARLLENPNPRQELIKAGAQGLCLRKIIYRQGGDE